MFGITKVFADAAQTAANDAAVAATAQGNMASLGPIIMMVVLFVVMYFAIIRPQKKKEKEAQAMINALAVGDQIVTVGGIWGKIVKIKDDYIFIETGSIGTQDDRSVLKISRQYVNTVEKKAKDTSKEEA